MSEINIFNNHGNISFSFIPPPPEKVEFTPIDIPLLYLQKYVNVKRKKKQDFTIYNPKPQENLLDAIKQNCKIILLGDAGSGKSTELKNAYNKILEEGKWKPFFIDLKRYSNQEFAMMKQGIWSFPEEEVIVFFDGLDEPDNLDIIINNILNFSVNQRPNVRVVISCRANIYGEGVKEFKPWYLQALNYNQINVFCLQFIGSKSRGNTFIEIAREKGLGDLLRTPFYLTKLLEYYDKNGALPDNKSSLFEFLVAESIKIKIDPKTKLVDNIDRIKKDKCRQTLEFLAFKMQCSHITKLGKDEIINYLGVENLSLIQKFASLVDVNDNIWSFTHLNFQEYLAALNLAKLSLADIKKIVAIKQFNYKSIYPRWYNTLSFLFPLLDNDTQKQEKLLEWVINIEPHLIISWETNLLDDKFKEKCLIQICEQHKSDENEFNYSFNVSKLIQFVKTDKTRNYLLTELDSNSTVSKLNILEIIGSSEINFFPDDFAEEARKRLWLIVTKNDDDKRIIKASIIFLIKLTLVK